jgi:hypothetical protein
MPTAAVVRAGKGVALSYSTDHGANWILIPAVLSIDSVDIASADEVDGTVLGSTAKTNRPELADPGESSLKLRFDSTGDVHTDLPALAKAPASISWKLAFPGPCVYYCHGWVKSLKMSGMKVGGNLEADMTIRHDSLWSLTPITPS